MSTIPFTRYILPNGRSVPDEIERPDEIVALAEKVIAATNSRFEVEMLSDGTISLTVTCDGYGDFEGDWEIELTANGPGLVGAAVDRLVTRAAARLAATQADIRNEGERTDA